MPATEGDTERADDHELPGRWGSARIGYANTGRHIERFAGASYSRLGVRPGQVVACQLLNWGHAQALLLAAAGLGTVVAPVMTTFRPRETVRMLRLLGPSVVVTVD